MADAARSTVLTAAGQFQVEQSAEDVLRQINEALDEDHAAVSFETTLGVLHIYAHQVIAVRADERVPF